MRHMRLLIQTLVFQTRYMRRTYSACGVNVSEYMLHSSHDIPGGSCPYNLKQNTNGVNGIFQSGVNSRLACQNRCNGNGLVAGLTCYAYDFNTLSRLCYIYTSNNYVRNPEGSAPGVNHYVKNCGGTSGN